MRTVYALTSRVFFGAAVLLGAAVLFADAAPVWANTYLYECTGACTEKKTGKCQAENSKCDSAEDDCRCTTVKNRNGTYRCDCKYPNMLAADEVAIEPWELEDDPPVVV